MEMLDSWRNAHAHAHASTKTNVIARCRLIKLEQKLSKQSVIQTEPRTIDARFPVLMRNKLLWGHESDRDDVVYVDVVAQS